MNKEEFAAYGYETPEFSLIGKKCYARVVNVYDGDSPTLVIPFEGKMFKFSTRVFGIDTSEMKSNDMINKDRALRARNRLIELITKVSPLPVSATKKDVIKLLSRDVYLVWIECMDMDKYGRVLVKVSNGPSDDKTFADVLIEEKLAYPYFGATKLTEQQQAAIGPA
jgi:endonuclease YncB( thermonuclease family)